MILAIGGSLVLPSMAFGLERVEDYYKPKASEYYQTDNVDIPLENLLYTGSHVGEVRGAKTGTIYNGPVFRSAKDSSDGYAFYNPTRMRGLGYIKSSPKALPVYDTTPKKNE